MTENIEEMMKKAKDAFDNDNFKQCMDLCNQMLILNPSYADGKILMISTLIAIYYADFEKEGYSFDKAESFANEILEILKSINNAESITEDFEGFEYFVWEFIEEWIKGKNHKEYEDYEREEREIGDSTIKQWIWEYHVWFGSRKERQERKKIKSFVDELSQVTWLQTRSEFIEDLAPMVKYYYKIVKDAAKLLIKINKDVDKTSELGIATKKLKRTVRRKKIWKGIKWFIVFIILTILVF